MVSGKPFGYVGNGLSKIKPLISQCPVVVSLPFDFSLHFATEPRNSSDFLKSSKPSIFKRPNFSKFGNEKFSIDLYIFFYSVAT
jgi:hypothetical protein